MTKHETIATRANESDIDGILELQAANQLARGGSLSASLLRHRGAAMMREKPLIVSRRDKRVTAFLMIAGRAVRTNLAIV